MSRKTSVATLRRYSFIAWCASLLLVAIGVVSWLLFLRPSLVGVDPGFTSDYKGNPIWLVTGVLFVLLGMVFLSIAYRWPRHLLRVLKAQRAKLMRLQIEVDEGSDHTQYYALLSDNSPNCWKVGLWASSQDRRDLIDHELSVMVYFDPLTAKPAVIEYDDGYLWAMKGAVTSYTASTIPGT